MGSGDKLHARDHQAVPHPVLGLQAGRHWSRHTDTTLKSIREVRGEINTWEMRLYYYRYVGRSFSTTLGSSVGPYLFTTCPSLLIRNFVKFHLMLFPRVPLPLG